MDINPLLACTDYVISWLSGSGKPDKLVTDISSPLEELIERNETLVLLEYLGIY